MKKNSFRIYLQKSTVIKHDSGFVTDEWNSNHLWTTMIHKHVLRIRGIRIRIGATTRRTIFFLGFYTYVNLHNVRHTGNNYVRRDKISFFITAYETAGDDLDKSFLKSVLRDGYWKKYLHISRVKIQRVTATFQIRDKKFLGFFFAGIQIPAGDDR